MMNLIIRTIRFLLTHKWKIVSTVLFTVVFLFILFPFKDLNDYISTQVSKITNKAVYFQFEDLSLNPITTSVNLEKAIIETAALDGLTMDQVSIRPSILALIKKQPGGHLHIDGLLGGNLDVTIAPGEKSESGLFKSNVDLTADQVSLKKIHETFKLSIPITGSLSITTKLTADLTFIEQPDGEINFSITNFELPSTNVNLGEMGNLNLPEIKMKKIDVKGRLNNGKMIIENAQLGQPSDDFFGTIKGDVSLRFVNNGGQISPVLSDYSLSIDLSAKPSFKNRASFFLSFLDTYKKEDIGVTRYRFKLKAAGLNTPPQFSTLN